MAELLAVLCMTDAFDILKENKFASLQVRSCIPLEDNLVSFIENSMFLPPMVCEPLPLTHNFSSGYLTHNDSLILGSGKVRPDGSIVILRTHIEKVFGGDPEAARTKKAKETGPNLAAI